MSATSRTLSFSAAIAGLDACIVRIVSECASGLPSFAIIGLPERGVSEARDRIRSALVNAGFSFPAGRILVNVTSDVRDRGAGFDLAIALGLLAMDEQIAAAPLRDHVVCGELALDGTVRAVPGVFAMTLAAKRAGFTAIIVAEANGDEAALVDGIEVYGVATVRDAIAVLRGNTALYRQNGRTAVAATAPSAAGDYADVRGQVVAKRALEVAAAGGHNVILTGAPGCGKTMLARRLPSLLPTMTSTEALDVTKIYSIAGLLGPRATSVTARPFRAPHHTVSRVSLVGGGSGSYPRPGEKP
jgi:magnesium chelatase family protein